MLSFFFNSTDHLVGLTFLIRKDALADGKKRETPFVGLLV